MGAYDHLFYVFSARDGRVWWRYAAGGPIKCSAALLGHNAMIFGAYDNCIHSVDPIAKTPLWRISPTLLLAVGGPGDGGAGGGGTSASVGSSDNTNNVNTNSDNTNSDNTNSGNTNTITSTNSGGNPNNGTNTTNSTELPKSSPYFASPVVIDEINEIVVVVALSGVMHCIRAGPSTMHGTYTSHVQWVAQLSAAVFATPLFVSTLNVLAVGSVDGAFHVVCATTGQVRWSVKLGGAIFSSACLLHNGSGVGGGVGINERVCVGAYNGEVYCLRLCNSSNSSSSSNNSSNNNFSSSQMDAAILLSHQSTKWRHEQELVCRIEWAHMVGGQISASPFPFQIKHSTLAPTKALTPILAPAPPAQAPTIALAPAPAAEAAPINVIIPALCVASVSGKIAVLTIKCVDDGQDHVHENVAAMLPTALYSPPVVWAAGIAIGARDDLLYCLDLSP